MSLTHDLPPPIRVLIADDSAVMRTALSRMLDASPQIRVCGTARNGQEVVEKTKLLQPDVVTLDVEMPVLNGVEALKRIMSECPCPVIMVSSATRKGADVTLEALSAGAFDYLSKENFHPGLDAFKLGHDLIEKIEAASHSRLARERAIVQPPPPPPFALRIRSPDKSHVVPRIVVLGTSTGGPRALQDLLPELPTDLPVSMIVVQHMPPGFTAPFAKRLDGLSRLNVREAQHGETIIPGTVYICARGPTHHAGAGFAPSLHLPLRFSVRHSPQALGGCHHALGGRTVRRPCDGHYPHRHGIRRTRRHDRDSRGRRPHSGPGRSHLRRLWHAPGLRGAWNTGSRGPAHPRSPAHSPGAPLPSTNLSLIFPCNTVCTFASNEVAP